MTAKCGGGAVAFWRLSAWQKVWQLGLAVSQQPTDGLCGCCLSRAGAGILVASWLGSKSECPQDSTGQGPSSYATACCCPSGCHSHVIRSPAWTALVRWPLPGQAAAQLGGASLRSDGQRLQGVGTVQCQGGQVDV